MSICTFLGRTIVSIFVTDIDDVLIDFVGSLSTFAEREYNISSSYSNHFSSDASLVWEVSDDRCTEIIDKYFSSKDFLSILPRVDALESIYTLKGMGSELYTLTSRHDEIRQQTNQWLSKYFPRIFTGNYFSSNIHTPRASGKTKAEVLEEIGANFFAEDVIEYALDASYVVDYVYMFIHPWNRNLGSLPGNIIEVNNWYQVIDHQRSIF